MKKWILISLLNLYGLKMEAQSSQIKLYLQQIAANKVLIGYIQKGYKIAKTGLTTISNIKNGEFNLHRDFFGSLKIINPKIKKSAMVVDIISLQAQIVQSYKNNYKFIKESGQFTREEIDYIYSVFTRLLNNTALTLDELFTLITDNKYQMSDDERLKRLDILHEAIKSNYVFSQHFGNEAMLLAVQRSKEKADVEISRHLLDLAPNN